MHQDQSQVRESKSTVELSLVSEEEEKVSHAYETMHSLTYQWLQNKILETSAWN